jgi:hypothetical protein
MYVVLLYILTKVLLFTDRMKSEPSLGDLITPGSGVTARSLPSHYRPESGQNYELELTVNKQEMNEVFATFCPF